MVSATEVAICATCKAVVQLRLPILGAISGTTIESPGFNDALRDRLPTIRELLFFADSTDPSARMTKTAFYRRSGSALRPD